MTVLVVDDEPKIRRQVRLVLEPEGFAVLEAGDGQEAVGMLQAAHPDVVLLDVAMPRLNGMDACRRIRALSDVPVVMVTAQGEEGMVKRAMDLGADDYLTKPFHPRELVARVRAVLRRPAAHA